MLSACTEYESRNCSSLRPVHLFYFGGRLDDTCNSALDERPLLLLKGNLMRNRSGEVVLGGGDGVVDRDSVSRLYLTDLLHY